MTKFCLRKIQTWHQPSFLNFSDEVSPCVADDKGMRDDKEDP